MLMIPMGRTPSASAALSMVFDAGWGRNRTFSTRGRDFRAYGCLYLVAGSGFYEDELNGRRSVSAGDVIVIFPGLRHGYGTVRDGDWTEVWLGCRGPMFDNLEREGVLARDRPVLHAGVDERLVSRFDALVATVRNAEGAPDAVLAARAALLLVEIAMVRRSRLGPGSLVARARVALEADLRHPLDLSALARSQGVGYDTLRRAFLSAVGMSPGRWRLQRRIERAQELLLVDEPLERIAEDLGFCNRNFLTRQFTAMVGLSPARWRSQMLARGTSRRTR